MTDHVARQQFIDGSAYPPSRTGLRGSHIGSFETAHAIRDGRRFDTDGIAPTDDVDLVVVGAGISGLAAAWFYRQRMPDASILILDNHDDFGGHAKRNEFTVDGRFLLGYGGSEAIQSPEALYGPAAKGLLAGLGVDYHRFERYFDTDLYPSLGLSRGQFFTKEAFGEDVLVTGDPMRMVADDIPADRMNERSPADFIADFPLVAQIAGGARRAVHLGSRPVPGARRGGEARRPLAHQLSRVRAASLGSGRRGRRHLPRATARFLRDRSRRDLGDPRDGDRLPGLLRAGTETESCSAGRDGGAVHLPLPRRERVHRTTARPFARA